MCSENSHCQKHCLNRLDQLRKVLDAQGVKNLNSLPRELKEEVCYIPAGKHAESRSVTKVCRSSKIAKHAILARPSGEGTVKKIKVSNGWGYSLQKITDHRRRQTSLRFWRCRKLQIRAIPGSTRHLLEYPVLERLSMSIRRKSQRLTHRHVVLKATSESPLRFRFQSSSMMTRMRAKFASEIQFCSHFGKVPFNRLSFRSCRQRAFNCLNLKNSRDYMNVPEILKF